MALRLKLTHNAVTRKLPLDAAPLDWPALESQISHRFGFDSDSRLLLSYDDADGDCITINSTAELKETFTGPDQPTAFTVRRLNDNSGPSPADLTCSTPTPTLVECPSEADTTNEDDLESLLGRNENTDPNEFVVVDKVEKREVVTEELQDPASPVLTATPTPVTKSTSTPSLASTEPLLDSPTPADADPPIEELQSDPVSFHDLLAAPLERLKSILAQRAGNGNDLLANLMDEQRRNSFAREIGSEVNDFVAEVINAVRTEARKESRSTGEDTEAGAGRANSTNEASASHSDQTPQSTAAPTATANAARNLAESVAASSQSEAAAESRRAAKLAEVAQNAHHHHRFMSQRGRGRGGLSGSPGRNTHPSASTPAPTPTDNPSPSLSSRFGDPERAPAPFGVVTSSFNATPNYSTPMPGSFDSANWNPHPEYRRYFPPGGLLFGPSTIDALNNPHRPLFGAAPSPPTYQSSSQSQPPPFHSFEPRRPGHSYPAHNYGGGSTVSRVSHVELRAKLRELGFHDEFVLKIACERVLADDPGAQMEVLVRKVLNLIL